MVRITADFDACEAYGMCVLTAPDLFSINDENFVQIDDETPGQDRLAAAREAVEKCPVQALTLED
jgi:ferredoxin